jgi:hypothetical protein
MSPYALTVRLPSGREYWYTQNVPEVGEAVSYKGVRYVVVSCEKADDERLILTFEEEIEAHPISNGLVELDAPSAA